MRKPRLPGLTSLVQSHPAGQRQSQDAIPSQVGTGLCRSSCKLPSLLLGKCQKSHVEWCDDVSIVMTHPSRPPPPKPAGKFQTEFLPPSPGEAEACILSELEEHLSPLSSSFPGSRLFLHICLTAPVLPSTPSSLPGEKPICPERTLSQPAGAESGSNAPRRIPSRFLFPAVVAVWRDDSERKWKPSHRFSRIWRLEASFCFDKSYSPRRTRA